MHNVIRSRRTSGLAGFIVASLLFTATVRSASVSPAGYTNDFTIQPPAEDWATASRPGVAGDIYDQDADVNAFIAASAVTNQTVLRANNPPGLLTNATWSSVGFYLQTRPGGPGGVPRYTALMAKFINNTGSNATEIAVSYLLTIAGSVAAEDSGKGTHVYYSLSGAIGSWVNVAALNTVASNGTYNLSSTISVNWADGTALYLLWADDNAAPPTDVANQFDNFSLLVTAGTLPTVRATVTAPANNSVSVSGSPITAAATTTYGTPPYVVQYWTNGGVGNTAFAPAGSSTTPPYNVSLGAFTTGTYNVYATVIDDNGAGTNGTSLTNTFFVVDPISLTLTGPPEGARIYNDVNVIGTATVTGGTAPYSVQFYLDGVTNGAPVTSAPYSRDFGTLAIGDHTLSASVTDATGWTSNSLLRTIHIDGPLSVTLAPTNGTTLIFGQSLVLAAAPIGGTNPHVAAFYTNDQLAGTITSAPFTLNLGLLAEGSYTSYVHATDSSTPAPQQANSTTNVITILPNLLLATLTSPGNGQNVNAGQALALAVTASVQLPLTVTNVEFFFDDVSAGADGTAPFSTSVTPALGSHTAYAIATDSLGRRTFTATNQFTGIVAALAAIVGPAGYFNDFTFQPAATDWATLSIGGTAGDGYTGGSIDAEVNVNITASGVTNQLGASALNPPMQFSNAVWSSTGLYLQSRPTGNRYTALMGKFLNDSGTNATEINIAYIFTVAAAASIEDVGIRAYYSHTALPGTWTNIPDLNSLLSVNASSNMSATLPVNWTNGGALYLLWADDNGPGQGGQGTDGGNQIDNFALHVTAGVPPAFTTRVTAPSNNALFVSGTPITASATAAFGIEPYTVEYFTNSGPGNTTYASAGSSTNALTAYEVGLGTLAAGTYHIYSVATDSAGTPVSTNSTTNTFFVANPIAFTLTAPANDAIFDNTTSVIGSATVSGGIAPYSVQFYFDGVASGDPITSPPYERNFGPLFVGDHTIRATVTDASGWVSNSLVSTVHITGPLGVQLAPTNGASFTFGQPVSLVASPGGGAAPYSVTFYLNDTVLGTFNSPPFVTNLGILAAGSYTSYVHATDSSAGTPQQADSTINVFTVLENPIVVLLTSPTNGQNGVVGQNVAITATASVASPLTVARVEFFVNGSSVGVDALAPYSAQFNVTSEGVYTFYAAAIDNLGRGSYSATNSVPFVVDPLANNNFASRFTLRTPDSVAGDNTGATTEPGEPTFQFGGGRPTIIWGGTLWWNWIAPFDGTVTIDTFGSSINTVLSIYTGSAVNALTEVQRNDNAPGLADASYVSFSAVAGTEYQIQVGGVGGFGQPVAQGPIRLNLAMPPFVAITNPVQGTAFRVGENISVNAIAAPTAGTVTNVSLYRGAEFLGSADSAPYSFVVSNSPVGTNGLYAVARDSIGQVGTSAVVRVLVANVGITITSPTDGSILPNTSPIPVSVFSLLLSGSLTNVEFFVDGQKFGEDTTAPFSLSWSNVTSGSHRLSAVGRADDGAVYNSQFVYIAVAQNLVASNSVWKYLDNGSDQGTAWIAPGFDDFLWASGPAPLGYSDSNGRLPLTTNSFGPEPNNKFTTTYYRHSFVASSMAGMTNLILNLQRDDGAVIYLNGNEVGRFNMPTGTITYATFASVNAQDDGGTTFTVSLNPALVQNGVNVLAVEIHQDAPNSSDIWFVMDLTAVPVVIRNIPPTVAITSPTNDAVFIAPASITVDATAADADGTVAKVEFFLDGNPLGLSTNSPYTISWLNPVPGPHVLIAQATDDQGTIGQSALINVLVYDSLGHPIVVITSPTNSTVVEGPTNMLVTAFASALDAVTNVEFFVDGSSIGNDTTTPYSVLWNAPFGVNNLWAVVSGADGKFGTSATINVTITIPPTNTVGPSVFRQVPLALTDVTNANFTNVTVIFSERVQNVDAGDLLVNGVPATSVSGSTSNYTFGFARPPYGEVQISFAPGHGITDFGYPTNIPFNELEASASWKYDYLDVVAPAVAARSPAAGATVTNLSVVNVTFSEAVTGVDAADLLLNGSPAFAFSGSGSNYVFNVIQPPSGTVNVTWATNHGIADLGVTGPPIPFNRTGAGNTWNFTLDARTTFVASNSMWRFLKGLAEASTPSNAWRPLAFDDSSWSNSRAPFVFGEPGFTNAANPGTDLSDMASNAYSSVYLRQPFVIQNINSLTNLLLRHQSDDGFIAWINGVEALRFNMPAGEIPFNGSAAANAAEQGNNGAAYITATLSNAAIAALVNGTNILAVHAFNLVTNPPSSDFAFNAHLYSFLSDAAVAPPRIARSLPAPGDVFYLTNLVLTFSESVSNLDAGDLLVNGVPASAVVSSETNSVFSFSFPQPAYGPVLVSWATNHGIVDLDVPPKPFFAQTLAYTLVNPSAPTVIAQVPLGGSTITGLTSIAVTFSEPVTGVDAADLLVNGGPALAVSTLNSQQFTFSFTQPPYGVVTVRWATNNGIQDLEVPPNDFDRTRPANQWSYALVNPVPSIAITSPTNGAFVLASASVAVNATATDNDGVIVLVEFFEGANKIGEDTNAPYSITLSNLAVGGYVLRAIATDNTGFMATSAPVVINVVTELPAFLTRGPYLQIGTPTGGIVRWRTDLPVDSIVRWGASPDALLNEVALPALTNEHIVPVSGLQPETKYYYSIGSSARTLSGGTNEGGSNFWFVTSPVVGSRKPTRIWILGDAGTAGNGAPDRQRSTRDAFYNYAAMTRPTDIWLMLGDNAYNSGTDAEHQAAVFNMYPETLRNKFLWPTLGNHETSQSTTATQFPYLDIFTLPQNGEAGGVPSGTEKYYSFDYANIHFVCLDSMTSGLGTNTAMANWLRNDLENAAQDWTIVFFHHPPYTKGSHDSDAEQDLVQIRQNLVPILEHYGVDIVLSGHSHCYERSFLLDGQYGLSSTVAAVHKIDAGDGREDGTGAYRKNEENRGVVYTVAGSSGQATGGQLNHPAHFISLNQLGTMVVDVVSNRLEGIFLTSSGATNDHFTLIKRDPVFAPITLTINGNGTVSGITDGELLEIGKRYTILATPAADSVFVNWTGGVSENSPALTFTMQSNLVITANFAPQSDRITIVVNGNGSVAGVVSGQLLEIGQTYTLTATPAVGWAFANWSGGVSGNSSTLTFVMRADLVIVANFVEQGGTGFQPDQLTLVINGNGTVAGATNGMFLQIGSNYTLVASAAPGWIFANWSGGVSGSSPTLNFVMQPNLVIVANFVEQGGTGFQHDQLTLIISGNGTVDGATNGQFLQIGSNYTLVATATEGWLFANWSGGVSGSNTTLNFTMRSNLVIVATFVPEGTNAPFVPVAGVFNGLFFENDQVQAARAGFFTLKLNGSGRYDATLRSPGKRYVARGQLNGDGKATNRIARANANALTVIWDANLQDSDVMNGSVSDGEWIAPLFGERDVFNAGNPAPQAGRYTLIIPGTPGTTDAPAGDGYATVVVDADGDVHVKGRLADGSLLRQNTSISKNGNWPLYASLYNGRGILIGWLHFGDDGANDLAGMLRWIKPSIPGSQMFPAGFDVNSSAIGSHYNAPIGGGNVLQITAGEVILSGGDLPDSVNPVTFGPNSRLVNNGTNSLRMIFVPASGLFNGTFRESGTGIVSPLKGAVLQRQNIGSGYAPASGQSGRRVLFQAAP